MGVRVRAWVVAVVGAAAVIAPTLPTANAAIGTPTLLGTGNSPSLVRTPAGKLGLAYANAGKVVYATNASGSWVKKVVTAPPSGKVDFTPKLAYDGNGKAYVLFGRTDTVTQTQLGVYLASNRTGSWTTVRVATAKGFYLGLGASGTSLYASWLVRSGPSTATVTLRKLTTAGVTSTTTTVASGDVDEPALTMAGTAPVVAWVRHTGAGLCGPYYKKGTAAAVHVTPPSNQVSSDFPDCAYVPAYIDVYNAQDGPHVDFNYQSTSNNGQPIGLYNGYRLTGTTTVRDDALYPVGFTGVVAQDGSGGAVTGHEYVAYDAIASGSSTNGIFLNGRHYLGSPSGYSWQPDATPTRRLTTRTSTCNTTTVRTCDTAPSLAMVGSVPWVAFQRGVSNGGAQGYALYVTHG